MRMICLANSLKHGGRCIAGIDESGNWVRPVSRSQKRAIGKEIRMIQYDEPEVLDILDVPLYPYGPTDGCQPENKLLMEGAWVKVGRIDARHLLKHSEDDAVILHNQLDYVRAVCFSAVPNQNWKSLQLVRNRSVRFERDSHRKDKWRALFVNSKGNPFDLAVTDPVVCERLNTGGNINRDCLLTISLAPGWSPTRDRAKRCYKFVAGVIELI